MLLGPFSISTTSVSLRACAMAGVMMAGAAKTAPADRAVIDADFRKSRRFM